MKRTICCLFLLSLATVVIGDEMPVFEEEIVVKGEAVQKTATVDTVTSEDIKNRGAKTVAEALEMVPGVYVRIGGKGEAYARIRGFRQREIAILIDGVPVSAPYSGQFDLSSLPVDAIERIEVIKGASSLLYGANAMGGVISIITKKSDGERRETFRAEYGTGDSIDAGTMVKGSLGATRYLLTLGYLKRHSFPLSDDFAETAEQVEGDRENSDRDGWNGQLSLGWDIGEEGRVAFNVTHADLERGLPHHEADSKNKYWRFTDWNRTTTDFIFDKTFGASTVKAKIYYDSFDNILDSYDDRTYTTQDGKKAFTSEYDDYAVGGDFFYRYKINEDHLLKLAVRPRRDVHREQGDRGEPWERYEADLVSLPIEGEWKPTEKVIITYGLSYDVMMFDEVEESDRSHDESSFNPQIAAFFTVNDHFQWRLSASRKTRFPNLRELFSSTSGNPDLETMKANIFEAGLSAFPRKDLAITFTAFYNDVKDLIDREGKNDPYFNVDEAEFKGFETSLTWEMTSKALINLAYTHLESKDKSSETPQYTQHRPKHKIDLTAGFNLPRDWSLHVNASYVSSQKTDLDFPLELDSYTLLDVRIAKKIKERWELYAFFHNILDELYYESAGYPMEGRVIYGGFRFYN